MENGYMTPAELADLQNSLRERYINGINRAHDFNSISNMTKNISPLGNLGIMLGTLGGKWAAQRYNDVFDKNVYKQRKINGLIDNFTNRFNNQAMGLGGVRYTGAGLPAQGVFASQIPTYLPNSKFYTNGEEWKPNFGATWQRPETDITTTNTNPVPVTNNTTPSNNTAPSITNNPVPSTALFGWDNPNLDWRNQNYFSNVTRPPYFSIQ